MIESARPTLVSAPTRVRLLTLACCAGVAALLTGPMFPQLHVGLAAAQPASDAGGANTDLPEPMLRLMEDYYHYATIGAYDTAGPLGQALLDGGYSPEQFLDGFRAVNARLNDGRDLPDVLDRRLLEWQRAEPIAEVSKKINEQINEGRKERATNPAFITEQVERLSRGAAAYSNALANLRNSGEYAVPVMVNYLLDPNQKQFQADIRRALRDLGLPVLSPLLAATQMDDEQVLSSILSILGDLRYNVSTPYLLEQIQTSQSQQVRQAAQGALAQIGYTGGSNAAKEFYDLAEKFYYQRTPIKPDNRLNIATIWSWGGRDAGLVRTDVPPQIYDEIMAMRSAGKSMALGQGQDQALALWLASDYRRESELKDGETDATRPKDSPSAAYYGTQSGVRYLQMVVERAERDRRNRAPEERYNTSDVALRAIKSLQEIVGRSSIGGGDSPLTLAMNYPDRRVRIEAAFALAQSLPTAGFSGQEQVVPLLADALSQTGKPAALVISGDSTKLNSVADLLRGKGYSVNTSPDVTTGVAQADAMSGVDVVVVDSSLGDGPLDTLMSNASQNPKLSGAAKLVLVDNTASRYEQMKSADPTLETTTATGDALAEAVEAARTSVGGLPLDPEKATELAVRSGNLLKLIGTSNSIFSLQSGQPTVLAALDDERPEVQKLAGDVAGLIDSTEAQPALLDKARAEATPADVRVSLFKSLADSAKIYGNRLGNNGVDNLLKAAADRSDLDVQAAAAEAVGALNLPADQARRLIIEDTKQAESPAS